MIGVQDEDPIQRPGEHGIDLVLLTRHREHHVQEILGIVEMVARIDEGLPRRELVRRRGNGRDLGDQAVARDQPVVGVLDLEVFVVEGGERADHGDHHRVPVYRNETQLCA